MPGATRPQPLLLRPKNRFQPSPSTNAGCDSIISPKCRRDYRFQPSPSTNAGCDPKNTGPCSFSTVFQPSPSTNAGCDTAGCDCIPKIIPTPNPSFNPHPARMPGATSTHSSKQKCSNVSTLTQHECRVRRSLRTSYNAQVFCFNPHPARMPGATSTKGNAMKTIDGFNPHPARMPGATPHRRRPAGLAPVSTLTQHNPHPARMPGATRFGLGVVFQYHVSTLTQHECRVRHRSDCCLLCDDSFNPHPARMPGATGAGLADLLQEYLFQPSPSTNAGCDTCINCIRDAQKGFNPHPARMPGATGSAKPSAARVSCFNPHPARMPGATALNSRSRPFGPVV